MMKWIVLGEKNGKILLVSDRHTNGILPKGSFLTVKIEDEKYILRVENSMQQESYSPEPLVIDMDLTPLEADRKCRNLVETYRVCDINNRNDGLVSYIKPQSTARLSNQKEIDITLGNLERGPKVFIATAQYNQNQLLRDEVGNFITANLPDEMFFHQMLICGKTGSGKTVASKYLAQYFVEKLGGAVLAINVKDIDLLQMNMPSSPKTESIKNEWANLNEEPHGLKNYIIYYPANTNIMANKKVNYEICEKITLDVKKIEPESLIGLLTNISDVGAMNLPNIFRKWQEDRKLEDNENNFTFNSFINYFNKGIEDKYGFTTLNPRREESFITLHRGTFDNIARNLDMAAEFFDNVSARSIDEKDILVRGKTSVIDVAGKNGIQFGSIILRNLLHDIVLAKRESRKDIPILIIIDEVHMFYNENASYEALGDLDTICRTGRGQEIGVLFASQNPKDIPKGLSSVINTKIFFKSDITEAKIIGVNISLQELEGLKSGFAIVSIHNLSQLKVIKFPLALCGVVS